MKKIKRVVTKAIPGFQVGGIVGQKDMNYWFFDDACISYGDREYVVRSEDYILRHPEQFGIEYEDDKPKVSIVECAVVSDDECISYTHPNGEFRYLDDLRPDIRGYKFKGGEIINYWFLWRDQHGVLYSRNFSNIPKTLECCTHVLIEVPE